VRASDDLCSGATKEADLRAITVTEYGATPAIAELPTPEPGPGRVLLKMRAAGMNPMDRTLASGDWKPMPATFPMVLGADGAGVVTRISLDAVPAVLSSAPNRPASGKTVITF